jgi:hypothetical protein
MTVKSSVLFVVLLLGLLLGSVASIRARSEPTYAPQLAEVGPMPGPVNPNEPPEDSRQVGTQDGYSLRG